MIISNDKIKLRAIEEADMDFCREMINSSYIEICTIGKSIPVSEKEQLEWFRKNEGNKNIRLIIENTNGPIGMIIASDIDWISRNCEVAIKIGAMNRILRNDTEEAGKLFLNYLFGEMNMHCVYAYALEENKLSQKLLGRFSFKQEGIMRQRIYKRGAYHDVFVYSLLRDEFYFGGSNE